jgi:hypothetical protein
VASIAKKYFAYLAIVGCISTGIIYLGIGVLAMLSYLRVKEGGADESSMLAFFNEYLAGKILIWMILAGTVCYIIWRMYEAFTDPYEYGNKSSGVAKRTGIALSTVADIMIVYSAVTVLLGTSRSDVAGKPVEQREMVHNILQLKAGPELIIFIGCIVLITAGVQFFYGITRGYSERLDIAHFKESQKTAIHILAWIGYFARGIIIGLIGFFLLKSGITGDAQHVINTDKAFDFIGDNIGHTFFIAIACGTICYALFMFSLGVTYDADKD